jgi:hypothetical protein
VRLSRRAISPSAVSPSPSAGRRWNRNALWQFVDCGTFRLSGVRAGPAAGPWRFNQQRVPPIARNEPRLIFLYPRADWKCDDDSVMRPG